MICRGLAYIKQIFFLSCFYCWSDELLTFLFVVVLAANEDNQSIRLHWYVGSRVQVHFRWRLHLVRHWYILSLKSTSVAQPSQLHFVTIEVDFSLLGMWLVARSLHFIMSKRRKVNTWPDVFVILSAEEWQGLSQTNILADDAWYLQNLFGCLFSKTFLPIPNTFFLLFRCRM